MGVLAATVLVNVALAVIAVRAVLPLANKIVLEKAVHLDVPRAASSFFEISCVFLCLDPLDSLVLAYVLIFVI